MTVSSPAFTSKQPVRGFRAPRLLTSVRNESSLIRTVAPLTAALTAFSILAARLLNAPQVLHASIVTTLPDDLLAGDFAFLAAAAAVSVVALRFGMGNGTNSQMYDV